MKPIFVSTFTEDYRECVGDLQKSMYLFGLDFDIRPMEDTGSWQRNCLNKPKFVWEMMDAHPGQPVVWIDSDAVIKAYPKYLDELGGYDVGVCKFEHPNKKKTEILSGTVYFAQTTEARRTVDKWIEECELNPDTWDQVSLGVALGLTRPHIYWLPMGYCFIYDRFRRYYPSVSPVIEHFQKSREMRRKGKS